MLRAAARVEAFDYSLSLTFSMLPVLNYFQTDNLIYFYNSFHGIPLQDYT